MKGLVKYLRWYQNRTPLKTLGLRELILPPFTTTAIVNLDPSSTLTVGEKMLHGNFGCPNSRCKQNRKSMIAVSNGSISRQGGLPASQAPPKICKSETSQVARPLKLLQQPMRYDEGLVLKGPRNKGKPSWTLEVGKSRPKHNQTGHYSR